MILRIAGAILVCAASAGLGIYMGQRGIKRADMLLEFKRTLLMLKSEIEYAARPLPQAFENIAQAAMPPFDGFYRAVAAGLQSKQAVDAAWQEGMDGLSGAGFAAADISLISAAGRNIGGIDQAASLAAIDMAAAEVDTNMTRLAAENVKNVKMYRSLGILGGLLIVVVLI